MKGSWVLILCSQIDCSSSKDGIANLRNKLQSLIDANVGLEKTNFWLGSENEILQKLPQFTEEQVKVRIIPCRDQPFY